MFDLNPDVPESMRYLIYRIYELLEKLIREDQELKVDKNQDAQRSLNHNKIKDILSILVKLFSRVNSLETYSFPYFAELLELAWSPSILENLALIGFYLLLRSQNNLNHTSVLFMCTTPFMRLLHHFAWNYYDMIQAIIKMKRDDNFFNDLMLQILEHGQLITDLVKDKAFLANIKSGNVLIHVLIERICTESKIDKQLNKGRFLNVIGEALLASFLLFPDLLEVKISALTLIQVFQGNTQICVLSIIFNRSFPNRKRIEKV